MLAGISNNPSSNKVLKQGERQGGQDQSQRLCQLLVYFCFLYPQYDHNNSSIDQANILPFLNMLRQTRDQARLLFHIIQLQFYRLPIHYLSINSSSPEAYNYYLQGNYYLWRGSGSGDDRTAIELYEKAIGLDPGFALAYSGKARCLLDQYWSYYDHTEDIKSKSKQAIDKAFEIDPDLPDAHLALGLYYYWGYLKYPQALKQFELVLKDQPKSPEVINYSAAVHRRAGNWEMAKSEYEKAVELNPGRSDVAFNAGETFDLLRNYSKAEEYYNMSILLQPDLGLSYVDLSRMYLRWEGDTRKAREVLGNAARNNKAYISDSLIIETNFLIDIYDGKYEEALKDISLLKNDVVQDQGYFRPKYLYNATIYGLMNRHELEHAYYDSARFFLERRIVNIPDDPRLVSSLGIVYA